MAKPDPLTPIRRERLQEYCKRHGWQLDRDRWNVTEIARQIGKPVNKASNLLHGTGSFGSKIAREIEDTTGLARFYLDGLAAWPFTRELQLHVESLSQAEADRCENVIRAHLGLPALPSTEKKPNGTAGPIQRAA